MQQVIHGCGADEGYLRPVVTRGPDPLGSNPATCEEPELIVIADHLQMVAKTVISRGAHTTIASTRHDGLDPRIKSLNQSSPGLRPTGFKWRRCLCSTAGAAGGRHGGQCLYSRDGKLMTPPTSDGALEGITRNLIMQLAKQRGITMVEASPDGCFLTGTGAELIPPVREVDGLPLKRCPGPVSQTLSQAFAECVEKHKGAQ